MIQPERRGGSPRRLVLVDFDWQDADLLPALLRMRDVSVRLVAGRGPRDAGVRVAAMCGLPQSVEIADLTREIFDLALVGERSPRREQLERLLRALGTPIESPLAFTRDGASDERRSAQEIAASPLADTSGNETALWPDLDASPEPSLDRGPMTRRDRPMPRLDDAGGIEQALAEWTSETGASSASIHRVQGELLVRVCRCGAEDPLLDSLVPLALRLDSPQLLRRDDGPQRDRLWAAWPFRSARLHGVVAVAGADPSARAVWEDVIRDLSVAWRIEEEGEPPAAPSLTMLDPDAFTHRLRLAVDRHRTEGFRFALHRVTFDGPEALIDHLLLELPERLRGTDCVCRPAPQELLLLSAGSAIAYAHVRRRIEQMWRLVWEMRGGGGEPGAMADERVELAGVDGAHEFLVTARGWVSPS